MKMEKNTWRIIYYMQKVAEFDDLPSERRLHRYHRLMKYKEAMLKQMKSV